MMAPMGYGPGNMGMLDMEHEFSPLSSKEPTLEELRQTASLRRELLHSFASARLRAHGASRTSLSRQCAGLLWMDLFLCRATTVV